MDLQKIRASLQLDAIVLFAVEEILAATDLYMPKSCLIANDCGLTILCPEGAAGNAAAAAENAEGAAGDAAAVAAGNAAGAAGNAEGAAGIRWVEYADYGFERVERAQENLWAAVRQYLDFSGRTGFVKYTAPAALLWEIGASGGFRDISQEIGIAMLCKSDAFYKKYDVVRQLNIQAYEGIRKQLHSGYTEQELCAIVRTAYVKNTGAQVCYTGDFLSGKRTCDISGPATSKIIRKGDAIIADALCACEGVYCDTTRSYFCGEPDKEYIKAYNILSNILDETAPLLRPGALAADIYDFVNRRLVSEDYGRLPHHAGHGLGYSWYEAPYFIPDCHTILQEDMFVTLEPGIYIPGKFGLRLENNYRVTNHGGKDVFCYKQEIQDFIIN